MIFITIIFIHVVLGISGMMGVVWIYFICVGVLKVMVIDIHHSGLGLSIATTECHNENEYSCWPHRDVGIM